MRAVDREATHRLVLESSGRASVFDPCVMCAITKHGWDPVHVVKRTEICTITLERFARSKGHLLVVLNDHAERVEALSEATYLRLQQATHRAAKALRTVLQPRRVYIASLGAPGANGSDATSDFAPKANTFAHVHMHILPIYEESEASKPANMFSWAYGSLLYDEGEAEALSRSLRAALEAPTSCET
jgi:diadenosine tetraphosphate (Ap4A) HIT family hydrolase